MPAVTEGAGSLRQRIQAARVEKQAGRIEKLPIPGYQGVLVGRYRPVA